VIDRKPVYARFRGDAVIWDRGGAIHRFFTASLHHWSHPSVRKKPRRSGVSKAGLTAERQTALRLTAEILPLLPVCVSNETF